MSLHADRRVVVLNDLTIRREILKLHKQGAQPHDLAIRFGMAAAAVDALLFGDDAIIDYQQGQTDE